ncbi:hypothetical protein PRIPAC_70070 [Pristionchus pacificus]|uniref:Uncharacterized protein n=1 Tax=Pristionchus pacificus TaxID=54126 RepID=A0A2A6CEK9_PRIPA|nr:hypothetical protein PRIPAC_70070 [Pristionchus pacificus]|eukprot:PDM76675.1 hypothetical protein PRIPAC_42070 [Pristionchus pacificus]
MAGSTADASAIASWTRVANSEADSSASRRILHMAKWWVWNKPILTKREERDIHPIFESRTGRVVRQIGYFSTGLLAVVKRSSDQKPSPNRES